MQIIGNICGWVAVALIVASIMWVSLVRPRLKAVVHRRELRRADRPGVTAICVLRDSDKAVLAGNKIGTFIHVNPTFTFYHQDASDEIKRLATGSLLQFDNVVAELGCSINVDRSRDPMFVPFFSDAYVSMERQETLFRQSFADFYQHVSGTRLVADPGFLRRIWPATVVWYQKNQTREYVAVKLIAWAIVAAMLWVVSPAGMQKLNSLGSTNTAVGRITTITEVRGAEVELTTSVSPPGVEPMMYDQYNTANDIEVGEVEGEAQYFGVGIVFISIKIKLPKSDSNEIVHLARVGACLGLQKGTEVYVRWVFINRQSYRAPHILEPLVVTKAEAEALVSTGRFKIVGSK